MPRTRSIRPGFFSNEQLGEAPPLVRLLFAGLWTVADREGRVLDRPKKLKAELFPYDNVNVDRALDMLADKGFIQRYLAEGEHCIQIINWRKHQHPHPREDGSQIPPPDGYAATAEPRPGASPEPDPGETPARLVASSSSSSRSFNSLRETPPNPPRKRRGRNSSETLEFDSDGPKYEQRQDANGKREWVAVP